MLDGTAASNKVAASRRTHVRLKRSIGFATRTAPRCVSSRPKYASHGAERGVCIDRLDVIISVEQRNVLSVTASRTTAWGQGDTGSMRLHHRWDDDEDRPEPDLTDPATVAAMNRAVRGVRMVKVIHLALLALGLGLLALALILRVD